MIHDRKNRVIIIGGHNGVNGGECLEMIVKFPRVFVENDEIGLIVESVDAQQQSLIFYASEVLC